MNILYTATWCNPCKQLKQYLADNGLNNVEVRDIDDHMESAQGYGVRGVPTLLKLDSNGCVVETLSGFDSKVKDKLNDFLAA